MTLDELEQQGNKTNILQEFEKFKATLSPEQLKEWHKKLDEVNNDRRKFLELRCKILNRNAYGGEYVVAECKGSLYIVWKEKEV